MIWNSDWWGITFVPESAEDRVLLEQLVQETGLVAKEKYEQGDVVVIKDGKGQIDRVEYAR